MNMEIPRDYLVFDTETTGLLPTGRICQVAAMKIVGSAHEKDPVAEFMAFVDPGIPIPEDATNVHGITDALVKGRSDIGMRTLLAWMQSEDVVAGWNVQAFDVPLLAKECERLGLWVADPFVMKGPKRVLDFGMFFKAKRMRDSQDGRWKPKDGQMLEHWQGQISETRSMVKWNLGIACATLLDEDSGLGALHRAEMDCKASVLCWEELVKTGFVDEVMAVLE